MTVMRPDLRPDESAPLAALDAASSQGDVCIDVQNLSICFGLDERRMDVVRDVNFRALRGKTLCLVGESGSGKSVTAQAIMNLLPTSGRVTGGAINFMPKVPDGMPVEAHNIVDLVPDGPMMRSFRGGQMGMIFQEPMSSLSPVHTIGDQIGENWSVHFPDRRAETKERTLDMLDRVGFPNPQMALTMYPYELSGGMRQRAMIAMALICEPSLLIADEPTTALDVTVQAQILKLLHDCQQTLGMTTILITHDLGVVANMADDLVVMYRGEVMEAGSRDDLIKNPQHPYLRGLIKAMPTLSTDRSARLQPLREIQREGGPKKTGEAVDRSEVLLSVKGVSKTYTTRKATKGFFAKRSTVRALSDINFDIHKGECLGLVGESGCGKTTLSKIITRLIRPDTGSLDWNGRDSQLDLLSLDGKALKAFRPELQMVFQDPVSSLSPRMTVERIVGEPMEIQKSASAKERKQKISEVLEDVGLSRGMTHRYPHSFSGGQRQRISIARAMVMDPQLLICDEPVSALDVSVQAQILNLLKDLFAETGMACLFVSHNMAVVRYIADRIMVMASGRIVETAPTDKLFENAKHPYTATLLNSILEAGKEKKLDFNDLLLKGASNSENWPEAFRPHEDRDLSYLEVSEGHFVLVEDSKAGRDLCA